MARLEVTYRDGTSDSVALGAFAQIAAKRRFGLEATKSDDPEVALFGVFVELKGPQAAKVPPPTVLPDGSIVDAVDPFDEWLATIETFGLAGGAEDDTEDPSPAESSEPSPESPPTSD